MFTRITKAGGHQYLQLVESFRNDSGKVRTRVVANLGRLDQIAPKWPQSGHGTGAQYVFRNHRRVPAQLR